MKQVGIFIASCLFSGSVIALYKNVIGPAPTLKNLEEENQLYFRPHDSKREIFFFNWAPIQGQEAGRPKRD